MSRCFARSESIGTSAISRGTILPIGCAFTARLGCRARNGAKPTACGPAPTKVKILRCSLERAAWYGCSRGNLISASSPAGIARGFAASFASYDLASYFSACVCSEDAAKRKPHPAPLQLALKRLRRDPEHCVYVGDTAEDIEMARSAGVRAIGVLGPFPTAARLRAARPEVILNSVAELPKYLRTIS